VNKGAQPLEVLFHPLDAAITLHQYVALCVVQVHHDAQSALAMSSDGRLRNSLWNCVNVNVAVVVSDSVNDVDVTFPCLPVIIYPGGRGGGSCIYSAGHHIILPIRYRLLGRV
jgi:hypothetical protein